MPYGTDLAAFIYWNNHHLCFIRLSGRDGQKSFRILTCRFVWRDALMAAFAYCLLQQAIIASQGRNSLLHKA